MNADRTDNPTWAPPNAPATPGPIAWITEDKSYGKLSRFRELVGGGDVEVRRFALPARLHQGFDMSWQDFGRDVVEPCCTIVDDPYPTPPRFSGTRAQRRLAATRAVQRARKHRRALHALLARWVRGDLQARMRAAFQEMAAYTDKLAWAGVPSGPYDPPAPAPGYTASCVVTCV